MVRRIKQKDLDSENKLERRRISRKKYHEEIFKNNENKRLLFKLYGFNEIPESARDKINSFTIGMGHPIGKNYPVAEIYTYKPAPELEKSKYFNRMEKPDKNDYFPLYIYKYNIPEKNDRVADALRNADLGSFRKADSHKREFKEFFE